MDLFALLYIHTALCFPLAFNEYASLWLGGINVECSSILCTSLERRINSENFFFVLFTNRNWAVEQQHGCLSIHNIKYSKLMLFNCYWQSQGLWRHFDLSFLYDTSNIVRRFTSLLLGIYLANFILIRSTQYSLLWVDTIFSTFPFLSRVFKVREKILPFFFPMRYVTFYNTTFSI